MTAYDAMRVEAERNLVGELQALREQAHRVRRRTTAVEDALRRVRAGESLSLVNARLAEVPR